MGPVHFRHQNTILWHQRHGTDKSLDLRTRPYDVVLGKSSQVNDQGPESTRRALDQWVYERGIDLRLIEAGKPTQDAYVESFNGKFRDECLYEHRFGSPAEAQAIVAAWQFDYNERCPPRFRGRTLSYVTAFTSPGCDLWAQLWQFFRSLCQSSPRQQVAAARNAP